MRTDRTGAGIAFALFGMLGISVNDMLIKLLSTGYPLHEIVFIRNGIGLIIAFVILQFEGGIGLLKTQNPGLHLLRVALVVLANSAFYAAIVVMPIATANAIYFVAPLFVTLLSIPVLREKVGVRRIIAVTVGFGGVLVMIAPELGGDAATFRWALLLPLIAAAGYGGMSVLTRKLGATTRASALTIYIQVAFLMVGGLVYLVAGDGRYVDETTGDSLRFLLRAWVWPAPGDWPVLLGLGLMSGVIGYCVSQAYRLAQASVVAPVEYILLLFSLFWGWAIFAEWPEPSVFVGAAIIVAAGIYVFLREKPKVTVRRRV